MTAREAERDDGMRKAEREQMRYPTVTLYAEDVQHTGCGGFCDENGYCTKCGAVLYSYNVERKGKVI